MPSLYANETPVFQILAVAKLTRRARCSLEYGRVFDRIASLDQDIFHTTPEAKKRIDGLPLCPSAWFEHSPRRDVPEQEKESRAVREQSRR